MVVGAAPAGAVITYVNRSCASDAWSSPAGSGSLTLARPPGMAVDDLMVMSVYGTLAWGNATPAGWTALQSSGDHASFYKRATAADVSGGSWNVIPTTFAEPLGGAVAGTIAAFRGVPLGNVPLPAPTQRVATNTSVPLPNMTSPGAGSMRVSSVGAGIANTTFANRSAMTFTGGATTKLADCAVGNGALAPNYASAGVSLSYEIVGAGITPSRTTTISRSLPHVGQTFVIPDVLTCSAGPLTLTAQPATVTFPSSTLNGLNQTQPGLASFTVDDQQPLHPGWNLSATSTTFNNGAGGLLPTNATTITGGSATAAAGNCSLPTNGITYPLTLPAAAVAPAAVKIFNAAATTGAGPSNVDSALSLLIPSSARTGTYTSTWTFTLATGP